jgi:hypothetical protein
MIFLGATNDDFLRTFWKKSQTVSCCFLNKKYNFFGKISMFGEITTERYRQQHRVSTCIHQINRVKMKMLMCILNQVNEKESWMTAKIFNLICFHENEEKKLSTFFLFKWNTRNAMITVRNRLYYWLFGQSTITTEDCNCKKKVLYFTARGRREQQVMQFMNFISTKFHFHCWIWR